MSIELSQTMATDRKVFSVAIEYLAVFFAPSQHLIVIGIIKQQLITNSHTTEKIVAH